MQCSVIEFGTFDAVFVDPVLDFGIVVFLVGFQFCPEGIFVGLGNSEKTAAVVDHDLVGKAHCRSDIAVSEQTLV